MADEPFWQSETDLTDSEQERFKPDTDFTADNPDGAAKSIESASELEYSAPIEDDLLDAVISLPKELFFTTSIPVCLWIMSLDKEGDEYRDRSGETLFVDARGMYEEIDRTQNTLTNEHIEEIADTVRAYRGEDGVGEYEDQTGFCKVETKDEIAANQYIITPGRYVGIEEDDGDDVPFEVKMEELSAELREEFRRSDELQQDIEESLGEVGF